MQGDLVERCAKLLCNTIWCDDGDSWLDACDEQRSDFRKAARSIIPIVLEEAISSVRSEHLTEPQDDSDHAYMRALHHAEQAIRAKMENLT